MTSEREYTDPSILDVEDPDVDGLTRLVTDTSKALAAASYGGMLAGTRLRDGFLKLTERHQPRDKENLDLRCVNCRTSSGKPAPWPCDELIEVGAAMGFPTDPDSAELMRTAGEALNGSKRAKAKLQQMLADTMQTAIGGGS